MKEKKIELIEPIEWFGKKVGNLALKAPSALQFLEIGEPGVPLRSLEGVTGWQENQEAVRAYIGRLLMIDGAPVDGGDHILAVMSIADGIQLKEALFDFFLEGREAISRQRQTGSSSAGA